MATEPGVGISVEVRVELRPQVEDAEAISIQKSLALMGLSRLRRVRTARVYTLTFAGKDKSGALRQARAAIDELLANPVVHQVDVRVVPS
ncbi:MAG: phosphoribosylformylglycinamidine synthase subunit PurS [Thermoplasmata archaeon]|nr:phosphoribosylformylglycinamidine synthase subunit PurS [Thermoplasmata archaeon]